MKRYKGVPVPCETSRGCPKGTPENPIELSAENWDAYLHHAECRAVQTWPDDPIVRRNATAIEETLTAINRNEQRETNQLLAAVLRIRHG